MTPTRPLCLASTSPRRKELLERFGLVFALYAPNTDEHPLPGEAPEAHVRRLAALKASAAASEYPGHLVLAGDTVVMLDGAMLGKPEHPEEAERMLTALSGRDHTVLSAYHLLDGPSGEECGGTVTTRVYFRDLPPSWIQWYAHLDESLDKAGAYGIQGIGGVMIERIEGSYNNVVGFPVEHLLWDMMEREWIRL